MSVITVEQINFTPTNFTVTFSVASPVGKNFYNTAPIDLATYQALTTQQKSATLIAAARAAAIPPVPPNIGLTVGQAFEIGS